MNILDTLIQAIKNKQQISFEYDKEGKIKGKRIGHPYAVFIHTAKNSRVQSTKVHIVQTDGVSASEYKKPFPSFRMYDFEELTNVAILTDREPFSPPFHEDYNSEWEGYKDIIAKV